MPRRPPTHVTGRKAVRALVDATQDHWICRELPEDYGIDCELELVDSDGEVTGAVIKAQVKGTASVLRVTREGVSVRTDTVRYWVSFPAPVIIVHVTVDDKKVRWLDVHEYLSDREWLDTIFSTRRKSIHFSFGSADTLPEGSGKLGNIAKAHQHSVSEHREDERSQIVADFVGYHLLIKMFDGDPQKWIAWLRQKGSIEQLTNDLPFVVWVQREADADPHFIERIKRLVSQTPLKRAPKQARIAGGTSVTQRSARDEHTSD